MKAGSSTRAVLYDFSPLCCNIGTKIIYLSIEVLSLCQFQSVAAIVLNNYITKNKVSLKRAILPYSACNMREQIKDQFAKIKPSIHNKII